MKSLGDQGNGAETQWPYTIKNTVLTKIVSKSKKKKKGIFIKQWGWKVSDSRIARL